MVPDPHAVRPVQKHHQLLGTGRGPRGQLGILEEGTREGGHDQEDGERPGQEQQPVVDLSPALGLEWNPREEHQRREFDHLGPLLSGQMNEDRDRDRGQTRQEQRNQKLDGHQRVLLFRSLATR